MTSDATGLVSGSGVALVGESSFALVGTTAGSLIDEIWTLLDIGSDIDRLLEALSAAGLRTLGSFALARVEPDGVRIAVRGDAIARVWTADDQFVFDARGVRTWAEHFVEGASSFELQLDGQLDTSDPRDRVSPYRFTRGVVPASAISWPFEPVVVASRPVEKDTRAPVVAAVDDTSGEVLAAVDGDDAFHPASQPVVGLKNDEAAERPVNWNSGETIHISRFDESTKDGEVPGDTRLPDAGESVEHDDDDGYDALYGRTIHRSVRLAAVEADDQVVEPEPASTSPAASPPSLLPSAPASDEPMGMISGVPITGVPGASSPQDAEAAPADQPSAGDHDGLTISAAQLRAMRAAAGSNTTAPSPPMGGPTVQAVLCRSGHPNPPHLSTCRACQAVLDAAPQIIARPSMGRIVLSTGDVVELTRPAIVGRNPKVEGRLPGEVPQTVRLDVGQALSRSHMMVRLEGWQVLVEDLGSANGTIVTLPGRPPQRLHAGEPILLEHGAHIDLGGEIFGTYEAGV